MKTPISFAGSAWMRYAPRPSPSRERPNDDQIRIVEARKLGRLPCFVVGPKATIVEEHAK